MKRADFIKKSIAFISLGIPVTILAGSCSDDDSTDPDDDPTDCLANGTNANISSNHGHSITVSKSDVEDGVPKTYSIQGSSSHAHQVTISSTQFATLKSNQASIQADSTSGGGHIHSITVSCA
jgi:hypothetical protein